MLLTDLQGGAAKGEVYEPLFGDTTFEDLKQNSQLAVQTMDSIESRIGSLTETREKLIRAGDIEGAAALGSEIASLDTVLDKTRAISEAQKIIASGEVAIKI